MKPQPAKAQAAVVCVNCSTLITQGLQLAQEVLTAAYEIKAYETMLQNLWQLGGTGWTNPVSDIGQIQSLLSRGSLLTGQISPIISRLQSAAAENGIALNLPQNFASQIGQWQLSLGNSSIAVQQQLQLAPQQQMASAQNLANAQADLQNAQGNLQAIQASGEITAVGVNTLMQVHDSLIAYLQSAQTQFATANERTAVSDQATANFLAPGYAAVAGTGYGPNGP